MVQLKKALLSLWKRVRKCNNTPLPRAEDQWIGYIDPEHCVEKHICAIKPKDGFQVIDPSMRFNPNTAPRHWWFSPIMPIGKQWQNVWDGKYYDCPTHLQDAQDFVLHRYSTYRPKYPIIIQE